MDRQFKTEMQIKKEQNDAQMWAEYQELLKQGGSKVKIKEYLAKKYGYYTISTVYTALKRAEKRMLQTI